MEYKDRFKLIGEDVEVIVDRPLHSKHPHCEIIYELNYGYIKGIKAPDGDDLDAYVMGIDKPIEKIKGKCIAVIARSDDDDDKLVVSVSKNYSDEEIVKATHFQERYFKSHIVRK